MGEDLARKSLKQHKHVKKYITSLRKCIIVNIKSKLKTKEIKLILFGKFVVLTVALVEKASTKPTSDVEKEENRCIRIYCFTIDTI